MKHSTSKSALFLKRALGMKSKASEVIFGMIVAAMTAPAFAASPSSSGSNMPWEGPLNNILTSIQGPVARVGVLLAIIITGLMMAFGEHGSGFKKIMGIAFGGAIVIGAVSFVSALFGATF